MDRKTDILTIGYLAFLILLFLSGSISGIISEVLYLLAFILPFFAVMLQAKEKGRYTDLLSISKEKISFALPLIAPTVSLIIIVSFLTSLLIYAVTGKTNNVSLGDSFVLALLSHALMPAVFEEMLFRYLPMRLLSSHSKRGAIIISAIFFSLVHHNLFSIPYAFLAGVIFMAIDIACDSVVPSILIHFINNALSVSIVLYADNPAFAPTVYLIIGVLTLISICYVLRRRKVYAEALACAFDKGEGVKLTAGMLLFALLTLTLAVASLI